MSLRAGLLAENGELARRWPVWLGFAVAVLRRDPAPGLRPSQLDRGFQRRRRCGGRLPMALPLRCSAPRWRLRCRRSSLRLAQSGLRLLDAMQPSAYGIFLLHYIFIIWLQYRRLRSGVSRRRQVRHRVRRHAWRSWVAYGDAAKDSVRGADDLRDLISARCEASNPESRRCDDASAPPAWMGMYDQLSFSRSDPACRLESPDASCSRMPASRSSRE